VIIECPSCHSKYQYDEDRFERRPAKKIKCARCAQVFEIHNPAFAKAEPAPKIEADATSARRSVETRKAEPEPEAQPEPQSTAPAATPQLPAGKRLSLAILDGPDAGNVFRIEKPRITIGRSNADLTLNDTESSRQHAAVEVRDLQITLSDLGSTNGTLVDGQKIAAAVELQNHSEFQVGTTTLMLIVTDEG
jgi:predicted Zn finger-like uncharacterized protein